MKGMSRDRKAEALLTMFCYFYDKEWKNPRGNDERVLSISKSLGYRIVEDIEVAELWHCIKDNLVVCSKHTTDERCTYEFASMKV